MKQKNKKIVAIDFETANESLSSVCSLGIAVIENNSITLSRQWLIKPPEMRFNFFNSSLHNITEKVVEKKPEFYRVWPSIKKYIDNSIIIAHNASFDISVLKAVLSVYRIDPPQIYYACTVNLARLIWKDLKNYKLNTLAESLSISFKHHRAKDDAFACASIAIEAAKYLNVSSFAELINKMPLRLYRLN